MQMDRNVFKRFLIYVAIYLAMLSWPSIYFHFTPLPAFHRAVAAYEGQTPIVMGGREGFPGGESYHRRNYILLPSFFRDPKFIKVSQMGNGPVQVTESSATFALCMFFAFVVFSWISLLRKNKPSSQ